MSKLCTIELERVFRNFREQKLTHKSYYETKLGPP